MPHLFFLQFSIIKHLMSFILLNNLANKEILVNCHQTWKDNTEKLYHKCRHNIPYLPLHQEMSNSYERLKVYSQFLAHLQCPSQCYQLQHHNHHQPTQNNIQGKLNQTVKRTGEKKRLIVWIFKRQKTQQSLIL